MVVPSRQDGLTEEKERSCHNADIWKGGSKAVAMVRTTLRGNNWETERS